MVELMQPGTTIDVVDSLNGLVGDVILAAGTGITLGTVGQTITINSTADLAVTLLDVSTNSATAPNSIYNLTATIPVNFKSSDGNTILYLDETNERIGIGTNAPGNKLQVEASSQVLGSATPTGAVTISNLAAGDGILELGSDTTSLAYLQSRNRNSQTYYALQLNPSGGNVNIGTVTDGAKLEVAGGGRFTNLSAAASGTGVEIGYFVSGDYGVLNAYNRTGGAYKGLRIDGLTTIINSASAGSVGIGMTPVHKLDVLGTSKFGANTSGERITLSSIGIPQYGSAIYMDTDWGTTQGAVRLLSQSNLSGGTGIGTSSKSNFSIQYSTNAGVYNTEASALTYATSLTVDGNAGFVGIGTPTPSYILDVQAPAARINVVSTTGTNLCVTQFTNTGGNAFVGMEDSVGGTIFTGTLAYAAVFGQNTVRALQFASGGAVRMTITPTGLVGIATTAADKALEINHATGQNLRLTYNDSNGSASNYTDLLTTSSGYLNINPSGLLASINSKLMVGGSGVPTYTIDTTFAGPGIVARFQNSGTDNHGLYLHVSEKYSAGALTPEDNLVMFHSTGSNAGAFAFASGNVERMRIEASGNVGIATQAPLTKLQINDSFTTGLATNHGAILLQTGTDGIEGVAHGLEFQNSGTGSGYGYKIYSDNASDYLGIAGRYNSATWTNLLVIKQQTGNVGIGTVSPGELLDVSGGAIRSTGSANNRGKINKILYGATTDAATAVSLTTDGAAAGASNQIAVPANTTLSIVLNICVKQSGSANAKQMLRQVVITNNGGTTALNGTVVALGTDTGDAGLATVTTTITADNTNDVLNIAVNGVAATNLRYTAYVVSCETLYA